MLRLLCLYSRVPAVLILNKLDTIPRYYIKKKFLLVIKTSCLSSRFRSRRIFDLIRKLTCNRVEGEEESRIKISTHDSKMSIHNYIKRKERAASNQDFSEETTPLEVSDIDEIYQIAKKEKLTEMDAASLTKGENCLIVTILYVCILLSIFNRFARMARLHRCFYDFCTKW